MPLDSDPKTLRDSAIPTAQTMRKRRAVGVSARSLRWRGRGVPSCARGVSRLL